MERHTEGGSVYGIRFFSRSSVRPAPARASSSRRMVFTASPRTKCSKGAYCRCRGKTCLQITKTAYRAKNSVGGFQLRQQESNLRWGSQSPLPYRLAMAHRAKQYIIFSGFSQEAPACFLPRGGRSSFMKNFWGFAEKPCQTVAVVVRCGSEVIQGRAGMPPPPGRHRKRCGARLLPGK